MLIPGSGAFHKSREHFVVVEYDDADDVRQAIFVQLHKDNYGAILAGLYAALGKPIVVTDDERKRVPRGIATIPSTEPLRPSPASPSRLPLLEWRNQLSGHRNGVTSVAFSPDGERVAAGSLDRTVIVWHLGRERRQVFRHRGAVSALAFSPDSTSLAAAGLDGTIAVWDTSTEQELT